MKPTALVVDDDLFIRQVLHDLLSSAGFKVVQAGDGQEALQEARRTAPDVILLDVVMPVMDGREACRQFRSDPRFKFTPIILMTARSDLEASVNPFQVGADDYLSKPLDGQELIARVQGGILKKQAIEALYRKARNSEVQLELTRSVSSSTDTAEILRQVGRKLSRLLKDVRHCSVALIHQTEQGGYSLSSSDDPNLVGLRIFLDHTPEIRKVMDSGRTLVVDEGEPPGPLEEMAGPVSKTRVAAVMLLLPLRWQNRVVGAMVLRLRRGRSGLSEKEMSLCQRIVDTSAAALENARRFRELREESDALRVAKRQIEEELQVKAVYEELFENASEGLAAFNRRGEVLFANRKALEIAGYQKKELSEFDLGALLSHESLRQLLRRKRNDASAGSRESRFDVAILDRHGDERLLSLSLGELQVKGGLVMAAVRDVTEKRRIEEELDNTRKILEETNRKLLELDQERAEYVNAAVHDLKVPITVISGYCTLLQEMGTEGLSAEQREYLEAAIEGSDRLVELVNNILDLSRLEAGKMVFEMTSGDLGVAVREACRAVQPLAEKNAFELTVLARGAAPATFDAESIHRVVVNLLSNAMKVTPAGGKIRVAVDELPEDLRVVVEDTGPGIPQERIPRLFEKFGVLGPDDHRKGTGLGLFICKKIIAAHHGRIWVESQTGRGSRFFFTLPKAEATS